MSDFSDTIVYVDEAGNHGLDAADPTFPVFVLAFCVFRKSSYITQTVPALQSFKFCYFGHDGVVFHEREIRKKVGPFSILTNQEVKAAFMKGLGQIMEQQPYEVIASIIDKEALRSRYTEPDNPYHLAMGFCLERLYKLLERDQSLIKTTHVIFEARGKREDEELELEFRRVCDGQNFYRKKMPFEIVMANKQVNSTGLQIADLLARPIGLSVIRPKQANHTYGIIEKKFYRSPQGRLDGFGRKVFP